MDSAVSACVAELLGILCRLPLQSGSCPKWAVKAAACCWILGRSLCRCPRSWTLSGSRVSAAGFGHSQAHSPQEAAVQLLPCLVEQVSKARLQPAVCRPGYSIPQQEPCSFCLGVGLDTSLEETGGPLLLATLKRQTHGQAANQDFFLSLPQEPAPQDLLFICTSTRGILLLPSKHAH